MKNFVENHPLFSHMSPKFKRMLELSLRRENFVFDTHIVKQGQKLKALYFILE
jgi:signal-transduction protein with cAMP-binding, CBS, and nucleotidyltransferase domain